MATVDPIPPDAAGAPPTGAAPSAEDRARQILADYDRAPELSTLLPQHRKLLARSAIAAKVAIDRGYRSVTKKSELEERGFSRPQCRVPALLLPVHGANGEIVLYQARPDDPRIANGKALKYETPRSARMAIDVPRAARAQIGDPKVPIIITEGIRKADAAVSCGLCCIGLLGVWNWRGTNEFGGKAALPDWESIALNGRTVYIVFDSDVMTKLPVAQALDRLKAFLENRHAHVLLVYLPPAADGSKVGLDDFLANGHTVEDLLRLATPDVHHPPGDSSTPAHPYVVIDGGLVWMKATESGDVPIPLTNFVAQIEAEVAEDDGVERRLMFRIVARVGAVEVECAVMAEHFASLDWVLPQLGAAAFLYPGFGVRDHARAAIQQLSGQVTRRIVYTHTGWRLLKSGWVYLHAAGALGADGPLSDVEVQLPEALSLFALPAPPSGADLSAALRASLRVLDVAPDRITAPLFAAIWCAPLSNADHSLFLFGPTGVLKTTVAVLAQQHFGPGMDAGHLPGSWTSTSNFTEELLFRAKDGLIVVDDFAPTGAAADIQRLNRDADRVFRAQANRSGRGRLGPDGRPRAIRPPRGSVLATGEDLPRGESLRARLFALEVRKGDVRLDLLSACQRDAGDGLFAKAMAGYIRWLAGRHQEALAAHRARVAVLRDRGTDHDGHLRSPETVATLQAAIECFAAFAEEAGALDEAPAAALVDRVCRGLIEAAADQREHQGAVDPVARFLELLKAAIVAGKAHLAPVDGEPASEALGWRATVEGVRPGGERIGWASGADVYLVPDVAHAVAQRMVRDEGESLPLSPQMLGRRLRDAGRLKSTERRGHRERFLVRRTEGGVRHNVLHLARAALDGTDDAALPETVAQRSQVAQSLAADPTPPGNDADAGATDWATVADTTADVAQNRGPFLPPTTGTGEVDGTIGPQGTPLEGDAQGAEPPTRATPWRAACTYPNHTKVWRLERDEAAPIQCASCHPPAKPLAVCWGDVNRAGGGAARA